ncbi:MAG: PKD domain-containing protein [Gammaproteobacteria bacterium]|nr:PKD domain-containing protein [Gammaproteobacteria bacterium]
MSQICTQSKVASLRKMLKIHGLVVFAFFFMLTSAFALTGDIDGSGRVDGNDLILFSKANNTSLGDLDYIDAADLDGNDAVDSADLALLTANFGFTGRSFNLWVADSSGNRVVRLDDITGDVIAQRASLNYPIAVSVNPSDGSLWVADYNNNRIVKLNSIGIVELTITGFNRPASLSVNETDGSCWVADTNNHRIIKLLPGITDTYDVGTDTGQHVTVSGFSYPRSVSVDPVRGNCWVADTSRDRVVKLNGDIVDGYNVESPPAGFASHVFKGGFNDPYSVSVNPVDGSCWAADFYNNQVVKLSETNTIELFRLSGFNSPRYVSTNPTDGSCWVADTNNNEVVHLSSKGVELSRTVGFNLPYSVSVNSYDGSCWVADRSNNQAVKVVMSGSEILRISNFNSPEGVTVYEGARPAGEPTLMATLLPSNADVGETVTFTGTAEDSDGTIVLYEWDFDGNGTFDYQSAATGIATHQYMDEGIFAPVFRATDDSGRVAIYYGVLAHIGTLRAIPGSDITNGPAPLTVAFTADYFDPEDGRIQSYAWDFDGDGLYEYQSSSTGDTTHLYSAPGIYTATLKVIDSDYSTATSFLTITAISAPPVATAAATPQSGAPPLRVTLEGTATDDGSIMLYEWDFDGNGSFEWVSAQDGTVDYLYGQSGTYLATFRATDNDGLQDTDTVMVSVNHMPTVSGSGAPLKGNVNVSVNFDCSTSDSDGTIALYEWDFDGDGTYDTSDGGDCTETHVYAVAGTFDAKVRVTDDGGGEAEDTVTITVLPTGFPIANGSLTPDSGYIPLAVTFSGTATDVGGSISMYEWSFGDEAGSTFSDDVESGAGDWSADPPWALDTGDSHSGTTSWTDSPGGNYAPSVDAALISKTFDFSAAEWVELEFWHRYDTEYYYDYCYVEISTNNGVSWTQLTTYRGTQAAWQKVTLDLASYVGFDQVKIRFRLSVDADATTGDGWFVDDIKISGIRLFGYQSTENGNTTKTYTSPGDYEPLFRVTDNSDNQDTDKLSVNVDPGVPTAVAGANPTEGLVPLVVNLTGNSSSDPNGTIDNYEWFIGENDYLVLNDHGYPTTQLFIGTWEATGCNDYTKHQAGIELEQPMAGDSFNSNTWGAASDADGNFALDSSGIFGPSINKYGYSYINIYSPNSQSARVKLGSDDTSRFWLNGQLVYTKNSCGAVIIDQYSFDITLQQGWNSILVAVYQGTGGFGLAYRFTDENDQPLRLPYLVSSLVGTTPDWQSTSTGNTTYNFTNAGLYPVTLRVTDNDGYSSTDSVLVKAQALPQVSIDSPGSGESVGQDVTFSATATDSDGRIVLYEWDFTDDSTYEYISSSSADAFYTYQTVGTFGAVLRVTDDDGLQATDTVSVNIVNMLPEITAISATPLEGNQPLTVTFTTTAVDVDGRITRYAWDFDGDGVVDWESISEGDTTHAYLDTGVYNAELEVTDNSGATVSQTLSIEVKETGAPQVTATATPSSSYTGGEVRLSATTDIGGAAVIRYEWDVNGNGTYDVVDTSSGSVVSFSSQYNTTTRAASNLIDGEVGTDRGYSSAGNPTFPVDIVFSFYGLQSHTVDRIVLNPFTTGSSNYWVKDFEIFISTTGTNPSDFSSVGTFSAVRSGVEQFFSFTAVPAKYVMLRILNTQSSATYAYLGEFKVLPQGATDNLLSLDGTVYHTYAGGGTYLPKVRVVNAIGITDTDTTQVMVYPVGEDAAKVWVVDRSNDRLVKLNTVGSELLSISGFSDPYAVDVDQSDGSVWLTDLSSEQLIKLDESGTELFRSSGFYDPYKVSVNQANSSVWIADYLNNNIVKLDPDGAELLRLSGFNRPTSVDVFQADGSVWTVEGNGDLAKQYAADGTLLRTVKGFNGPRDVAVHPVDGTVWIADRYNDRVVRLASNTPDNYDVNTSKVTVVKDNSANDYLGYLVNGSLLVSDGKLNDGVQFDGDGDYIRVDHNAGYRPTDVFSVETWVYSRDWQIGNRSIISTTENGGWNFSIDGSVLRFQIEIGDVYYEAGVESFTVSTNQWHHLAGVYDGSEVKFYVDGVLQASTAATGAITYHPSNAMIIGGEASSGTGVATNASFFGKLDEVRLWDKALSISEITSRMNAELIGNETNLLAYYDFNDGIGPFHKIISGFNDPVFVDVNSSDGTVWVSDYLNRQIVQISEDGENELTRVGGYYNPHMLSINDLDGTVWIPDYSNYQVVKLSPNGTELVRNGGYYNPSGVSIDQGVRNLSQPPVAHASATPHSGAAPLMVTFTGSGTDNGSVVLYEWDFEGDGIFDYSSAANGNTSHTYSEAGIYRPVFRVTDNTNLVDFAYLTIRVGDFTITAGATPNKGAAPININFSGSATSINGVITLYEWDFDGDGVFDWSSTSTANINSRNFPVSGLYIARLRVTDSIGATAEEIVPLSIISQRPEAKASVSPATGSYPLTVSLNNDSSSDADGSIVRYEWDYDGDGAFDYSSATQGSTSFRYELPGVYFPTLRVTDNDQFIDEKRMQVTVIGSAPVATASGSPITGDVPLQVNFSGIGSDLDGSIAMYEWSFGDYSFINDDVEGGNVGWVADYPWAINSSSFHSSSHSWTDSPSGFYDNNANASLTSSALDFTNASTPTLVFYHHYDLEDGFDYGFVEVLSGGVTWEEVASFTGTGESWEKITVDLSSYIGSANVKIRFRMISDNFYTRDGWYVDDIRILDKGFYTWNSALNATVSHTYPSVGVYSATLRVTDDSGLSATDTLKITVMPVGSPIADIQATPTTGGNPLFVSFDPGGSSDTGTGTIVKYEWDYGDQIKVESGARYDSNRVAFYVDDNQVGTNGNGHNIVVIDEDDLSVLGTKSFDTWASSTVADQMAEYIRNIPDGSMVLVAIKYGQRYMNNNAHSALETLGSQMTRDVGIYDSWAFIGIKGETDRSIWEKLTPAYSGAATVRGGILGQTEIAGDPVNYTYHKTGKFIARLRVTDNSGLIDEDTIEISIGNPVSLPAAYPPTGTAPLLVKFICNGEDIDGTLEYFKWDFDGNGTVDATQRRSDTVNHTFNLPGVYHSRLQVIDNDGLSDEKSITIVVTDSSTDGTPVAEAYAVPSDGDAPLMVSFSGYGTDIDGTLALFEWDFDGDGIYDWSSAQAGVTSHNYSSSGLYVARFRVTDDEDKKGTATVLVNVHATVGPVITAAANPVNGNVPFIVDFTGSAQSDDLITLYEWDFDGDGTYDWSSPQTGDVTHQYAITGVFNAMLRVTDDQSATNTASVAVTVTAGDDLVAVRSTESFDPSRGQSVTISTALSFDVDSFTLRVNDAAGSAVRLLADGVVRNAGLYTDVWDGTADGGSVVDSGVYFFVIDYEKDGILYHYDLTGESGTQQIITPAYSNEFIPIEDKFLTATFSMSTPAEITTYVSPFTSGAGDRVRTIHLRTPRKSGLHVIEWDGVMDDGTLAPLNQNYVMAVFAYSLSDNALIVATTPIVSDVSTDPDYLNPGNPYNPEGNVEIKFSMFKDADVTVSVYDENMYLIQRWTELNMTSGQNTVEWDGLNTNGALVAPGYYRVGIKATDSAGNSSKEANGLLEIFY